MNTPLHFRQLAVGFPGHWCSATVTGHDGATVARYVFEGPGLPDLAALDQVARVFLFSARLGGTVALVDVSPAMEDLLALVGLSVEMRGETELGEESIWFHHGQEEGHGDDPTT